MLRKQPEIFWAKPSGLELTDPTGQQEKTQLKSPCFLLWSYKFCCEQCAHTQQLGGLSPIWILAGLERNSDPAGVSAKAKERRQKKTPGAAWLEAKPEYNASLVGLVKEREQISVVGWTERSVQVPAGLAEEATSCWM